MAGDPLSRYLQRTRGRLERLERLRPMTPGEVLDLSFRVYQELGRRLLRITALPSLLCLAALAFLLDVTIPSLFETSAPTDIGVQVFEAIVTIAIAFAVAGPLLLLGLTLSAGITVSVVSDYMLGRIPDEETALARSIQGLRSMFLVNLYELIVGWSGVLIGATLLMVSALIPESSSGNVILPALTSLFGILGLSAGALILPAVLVRHSLATPAAVLERLGPLAAARRSIQLLRGSPWHPSGYGAVWMLMCLIVLFLFLLSGGIAASMALLEMGAQLRMFADLPFLGAAVTKGFELLPWYLTVWTLVPVWCTTTTILYYERRIRLEGYDIEALAQEVWRSDRSSRFEL